MSISITFKDRFEEFAFPDNKGMLSVTKDEFPLLLSEIDKHIEKEIAALKQILQNYIGLSARLERDKENLIFHLSERDKQVAEERKELLSMIAELKDDLSSWIDGAYDNLTYPVTLRRFNRDMENVKKAELLISKYSEGK